MFKEIDRVLLVGAGTPVGQHLLQLLHNCDVKTRAVTHTESNRPALRDSGADSVVVVNLRNSVETTAAIRGCDTVLSVLGSEASLHETVTRRRIIRDGTKTMIESAVTEGVDQFVMLSSNGVGNSKSNIPLGMRLIRLPLLRAKRRAEQHLRDAALSHTIIRPGKLTDAPPADDLFIAEGGDTISGTIPRESAAQLLISALWTREATDRTFEAVSRDGLQGRISNIVRFDWKPPVGGNTEATPRS